MKHTRLILICLLLTAAFFSCKKDETPEPETPVTPPAPSVSFAKQSYYKYESAEISVQNLSLTDSTYNVTINSNGYTAIRYRNSLFVSIPDLAPAQYTLSVTINGTAYTAGFTIVAKTPVADPQTYVTNLISNSQSLNQGTLSYLASMSSFYTNSAMQQDLNTIQNQLTQLQTNFNGLSATDKQKVADILDANKAWLDELNTAQQNVDGTIPAYLRTASTDQEMDCSQNMQDFTVAEIKAGVAVGLVAILIWTEPPVGAIAAVFLVSQIKILQAKMIVLVNCAFAPFTMNNVQKIQASSTLQFNKNVSTLVQATGDYRTVYSGDINSSNPALNSFTGSVLAIARHYNNLKNYLSFLLTDTPFDLAQQTSYDTYPLLIHASHLSITGIDNQNVSANSTSNVNGDLYVSFTTSQTSAQSFNFNVTYSSQFGNFSYPVSAMLNVPAGFDFTYNLVADDSLTAPLEGKITMVPTGGTPPYQCSVDGGGNFYSQTTFTNLMYGYYSCVLRDTTGLTVTKSFYLPGQP
jgi:hypothetical protein